MLRMLLLQMSMNILHEIKNRDPESRWTKIRGVTLALICLAIMVIGTGATLAWQTLGVPVIGAFAELGRDLKIIMKGEG